ncbi:glycosyltransferase family 4 protein [Pseudomonas sp. Pseusp122]|uniref:glycosyltransferase family 4 protein n=1 Tax=unclassified Pseudomonas TaxID=196821 RepID=UPI0039A58F1B
MKIVLIGTTANGMLGFRSDLIVTLVEKGFEVYAFAIDYCNVTRRRIMDLNAIPVDYRLSRAGLNPLVDAWNCLTLARQIRKIAPAVVFSYFVKPVIFGTLAARLAGVERRIAMLEGLGYAFTDYPGKKGLKKVLIRKVQVALYRFSFRFLERLIFLNPDDPKDLLDRYRLSVKKSCVLGGIGVNLQDYPYTRPTASPVSFIFVGRLLAEKGVHEFVGAARLIKLEYPEVKFFILGGLDRSNPGGLSEQTLSELVDKGVVIHPGHVDDVSAWLRRSSVFVLPSFYREGVPRSTQEAMAIGRPVITTDVPGCRETVVDGENGFLIPPYSAPALVEKMRYFIEHPEQIERMGLESYAIAQKKFDAKEVNARLVAYFD